MAVTITIIAALFVLGAFAGRWIDFAASAIPARQTIRALPGCPDCGQPLAGLAWLPLAGPFLARRCPACQHPAWRPRALTEVIAGLLFALAYLRQGPSRTLVATLLFSVVLLLILRIDWRYHAIYPTTIIAGLLLALGNAAIVSPAPSALLWSLVGAAGATLVFLVLYLLGLLLFRRQALGFGDVLLAALIGAMAGPNTAFALFIGMLLGALGGLLLVALRARSLHDYLPYGAYLCAGTIATLLLR